MMPTTLFTLRSDQQLEEEIIRVFECHRTLPSKDLAATIRQQLSGKYNKLGSSEVMFAAIKAIVKQLTKEGRLAFEASEACYTLVDQPETQPELRSRRPSRDRTNGRQPKHQQYRTGAMTH